VLKNAEKALRVSELENRTAIFRRVPQRRHFSAQEREG